MILPVQNRWTLWCVIAYLTGGMALVIRCLAVDGEARLGAVVWCQWYANPTSFAVHAAGASDAVFNEWPNAVFAVAVIILANAALGYLVLTLGRIAFSRLTR